MVVIFLGVFGAKLLPKKITFYIVTILGSYTPIQLTTLVTVVLVAVNLISTSIAVKTFRRTDVIL